ncbi:hypothetical protein QYF61_014544 [Mycteria americana]|uniref:Mucin-4 n=1 Tax=Mycteria americana TaxID=33587 RepID=A0AAN7NY59_MYCAM|nr:hypothetical protein QYF61_014544 [Mycteria americana]
MGTAETSTAAADAEISESIPAGSLASPSFPPGAEPDALVTAVSEYGSTVPTLTNVTKPLNVPQDNERGPAAPTAATTAAAISAQHPAVTPEAELDVTGTTPDAPLGATPLFTDVKEDVLAAVTREGVEDLDPTASAMSPTTTPPLVATWWAQPTAGSPVGANVTVLPSQGLTTATGPVEEGISLPVDIQSEASANSFSPSPSAGGLLTTQQDGVVSGAMGITPESVGETAPAAEENPLASVPGDGGDAVNGEFSTAGSSRPPLESMTVSGTVENPGESSLLPAEAAPSPAASLAPAGGGDRGGQGAPGMSSDTPGSSLLLTASEAPAVTGDTATSLPALRVPTDAQGDMNPPALTTALLTGDVGAVGLAEPSLQPAPWQSPTGEQSSLIAAALPTPTDTPSAPGAAYPPLGVAYPPLGAGTLPAADEGTETPVSSDFGAAPGAPMSPSLGGSQPWGTAAGVPQGADGPSTGLNSASDAPSPVSFVPDGLAWPAAGVLAQGAESAGEPAQAGGPGDGSPYADTKSDTSPSAISAQQDPANTGEPPAGGTGPLVNAELPPPSAPGDGAGAGAAPALGQVSPPGPAPPGSAGLEPNLSGAEGPGDLPGESPSTPGAAYPPVGAAASPVSGAETPVSPDLGAAQGAPVPPSLGGSQPWGMAAAAPQGAGLPGAEGPDTSLTWAWDVPSSAAYGPAGPPSPALGDQLGPNLGLPAVEEHGAGTAEQPLGGAGSRTGFEPSMSSAAGSGMAAGMDQLPGAGSPSSPASPSGAAAASSVSDAASPSALKGAGGAPGALQPSLGAGPGVPPAAGEGAAEAAGDGASLGQSQAPAGVAPAGSGAPDGELGAVLHSASSSPSTEGPSSPGMVGEAANRASLPGTGGAGSGLETAGLVEPPVSAPGVQSGADLGLSDAKLSQVNVVELPGGASVKEGPSPGASLGEGAGAIIQIASGALAPSALTFPQETQPPVPVAPDGSGVSEGTTASLASLLLPGHGLSSGLAPNGDPHSAPSTQSGSRPLVPGAPGGLAGDAGGTQTWSLEDEVASGMPAPLGEASPRAPASPSAALVLPSAPQRENTAEGASADPRLSTPLSGRELIVGSSAGGRGELGAAALGGPALLLPPLGSPRVPSSPVLGEASAVFPGVMAGRGDMARLLPGVTGAGAAMETPAHTPPGGSPGLPGLPPAGIAAGSPGSKVPGPGPAGGLSPATLQPFMGGKVTTSLANGAPAAAPPGKPVAAPTLLPGPAVAAVPLYAYGARENDLEYVDRKVDFNSPLFKPETGFPFGKTLHDSLYFTDNGQIIFPASDNSIFTYPNPPPSGFNGHEKVPMIAVFWDNADFSRGIGTTFYQEFPTLNTDKPPFVRDVEAKVRRYLRSSYSAAWTLKITWEKAPAYAARTDTWRTITYQAVLTTDGFRSYVLMLYQEGGMRWDYTRLTATNVLIGYTSGDGFYHNDDLTQRPPAAKYRPDQFRGYNTDLRGLWIYKLESRVGVNYRLKCLAWTGRQQEPRAWTQGLPACPCSLQQGQQDPRFKSSRGGKWTRRFPTLLVTELSLTISPARVAGVPPGWADRGPQGK